MIYRTDSCHDWQHHTPKNTDAAEKRSCQIFFDCAQDDGKHVAWVNLELRSHAPMEASLIAYTGELLPIASGTHIKYRQKVVGYVGVDVVTSATFAYRCNFSRRWFEQLDPTPVSVTVDQPANPLVEAMREELHKYLRRKELDETFKDDVSVEELLDDLENGDLEFEQEPDPFGLGYEERLAEYEEARRAAQEADNAQPAAQPPGEAGAPAGPANAPETAPASNAERP